MEDDAFAFQPLHTFTPKRIPFASILACNPRPSTEALRFVIEKKGTARELFLNLAVVKGQHRFMELLGERLEAAGVGRSGNGSGPAGVSRELWESGNERTDHGIELVDHGIELVGRGIEPMDTSIELLAGSIEQVDRRTCSMLPSTSSMELPNGSMRSRAPRGAMVSSEEKTREPHSRRERTTAFSVQLLAETTDRTATKLATDAIRSFVELQEWQVQEIKSGLREADAGEFATDEEVAAVFAKWANAC